MNLIVAVDSNWAIGKENKLLVSIPQDMKFFRETTKGKVVKDTVIVHSVEEMVEELKKYNSEDVYVIGGESIYRQLLPYCTKAYVTKIDHAYDADTYFPDLDADPEWEMTKISDEQTYFDLEYVFVIYERR